MEPRGMEGLQLATWVVARFSNSRRRAAERGPRRFPTTGRTADRPRMRRLWSGTMGCSMGRVSFSELQTMERFSR